MSRFCCHAFQLLFLHSRSSSFLACHVVVPPHNMFECKKWKIKLISSQILKLQTKFWASCKFIYFYRVHLEWDYYHVDHNFRCLSFSDHFFLQTNFVLEKTTTRWKIKKMLLYNRITPCYKCIFLIDAFLKDFKYDIRCEISKQNN